MLEELRNISKNLGGSSLVRQEMEPAAGAVLEVPPSKRAKSSIERPPETIVVNETEDADEEPEIIIID